jgi:protein kinase X
VAVDWWALGILLFEMVVGHPPFYGPNPFVVYQKILETKITFPTSVPRAAKTLMSALLTPNRSSRLGSGSGGFEALKRQSYFSGIDWVSASQQLIMPPMVPTVTSDGDTSNFDIYPDENVEEHGNLTSEEREQFREIDRILERPTES